MELEHDMYVCLTKFKLGLSLGEKDFISPVSHIQSDLQLPSPGPSYKLILQYNIVDAK
jgi:hypothetical protein